MIRDRERKLACDHNLVLPSRNEAEAVAAADCIDLKRLKDGIESRLVTSLCIIEA